MHDVNHHITAVDEHPFTAVLALGAVNDVARFTHLVDHIAGQRAGLSIGVRAGDGDVIRNGGNVGDIDQANVFCLDVLKRIDNDVREVGF